MSRKQIDECIRASVEQYFKDLRGAEPGGLHELATGQALPAPPTLQVRGWLLAHLQQHYALYGEFTGVRSARKHIGWAVRGLPGGEAFRQTMNRLDDARAQVDAVAAYFDNLALAHCLLPAGVAANDGLMALQA